MKNTTDKIFSLVEIPEKEKEEFDAMVKEYRKKYIRSPHKIVEEIFTGSKNGFKAQLVNKQEVSEVILASRDFIWKTFLVEESEFNATLLKDLYKKIKTPKEILDKLINNNVIGKKGDKLFESIKEVCGEYAGRVYPYIYSLSLSNTNSRRARAGSSFEAIIYTIYNLLDYPFDSQRKIGRKVFEQAGLGKKVDSVLPGIDNFKQRRNKTIIGTMKTSLRERWQEVAEEIERTKIPEIHLLTVDDYIARNKAEEMKAHNIVLVTLKDVADSKELKDMRNVISFEEYFFHEIPNYLKYWNK